MSAFILGPGGDAAGDLRRFAAEVAPAVREAVDQARATRPVSPARLAPRPCWRCTSTCARTTGPSAPSAPPTAGWSPSTTEDAHMFRDLRRADPSLGTVLDRLSAEHEIIAGLITEVDAALVAMIEDEGRLADTDRAVDRLAGALLPHLRVEEDQLLGPIAELGIRI